MEPNLHLKSPSELHCGRGHGEHSVCMGRCSVRVAKHDGNAGQKKSEPENVFMMWTDLISAVCS